MDTPTFHRADTNRVILIVHEGVEPTGDAQAELLRLFMDAAEHRHVESVSACSPAGREILRLAERERELKKGLAALLQDAVRYERLPPDQPSIVNARALLKEE